MYEQHPRSSSPHTSVTLSSMHTHLSKIILGNLVTSMTAWSTFFTSYMAGSVELSNTTQRRSL